MKTLVAWSAWAILVSAWPGLAEAQSPEYTRVYETYQAFTRRDAQSFNEILVKASKIGFFDQRFASCLTVLEKSWVAQSRGALCDAYPPGSVEKAGCYGRDRPGYLLRWSLSLRQAVSRGTPWDETEIGREIATGEAFCAVLGSPELCQMLKGAMQQDGPQMRTLLVCG
jgi:hypothetical protein